MYKILICIFILAICAVKGIPSNLLKLKCDIELSESKETCYADNDNPYPYTGVKTPYDFVHNNITKRIALEREYIRAEISARYQEGKFYCSIVINCVNAYFRLQTAANLDADQTWHSIPE